MIISVLIPTYNRAMFLKICVERMLQQTYDHVKIVIYDDGSTDNTKAVVFDLCNKYSNIFYYSSPKNRGAAYARNQLLNICNTKLACWQDSDDFSNIHRVQMQYDCWKNTQQPLIISNWISNKGLTEKPFKVDWSKKPVLLPKTRPTCFPTTMFEVAGAVEFNTNKVTGEDVAWRSAMKKLYGVGHKLNECLYYVRFHNDRLGNKK